MDADGIAGDCRIEAPHGEVNVHAVEGDLIIENSYERVRVEKAAKALTISGPHSDILVKDIGGRAEIGSSYEAIRVVGALDVKIRGQQSEIELEDIKGAADVVNDHGFVRVRNATGGLKIDGRDVGVSATGIAGPEIRITTSYQDVDLLDFAGPAVIVLSHGDLHLRPQGLAGAVDVQGSYAGVDLEWPAGIRGPLERPDDVRRHRLAADREAGLAHDQRDLRGQGFHRCGRQAGRDDRHHLRRRPRPRRREPRQKDGLNRNDLL